MIRRRGSLSSGVSGRIPLARQDPLRSSRLGPEVKPVEATIGKYEHSRAKPTDELSGELYLPNGIRANDSFEDCVASTLGKSHYPSLGKGSPLTSAHMSSAEILGVLLGIGDLDTGTIDGDYPPICQEGTLGIIGRQWNSYLRKEFAKGLGAKASLGLEDRGLRWRLPGLIPSGRPRKTVGQLGHHLFIRTIGIKRHPDGEVGHNPSWQSSFALLGTACSSDHLINEISGKDPGQYSDRY